MKFVKSLFKWIIEKLQVKKQPQNEIAIYITIINIYKD